MSIDCTCIFYHVFADRIALCNGKTVLKIKIYRKSKTGEIHVVHMDTHVVFHATVLKQEGNTF